MHVSRKNTLLMPVLAFVAGSGETDTNATYRRLALIAGDRLLDAGTAAPVAQGWVLSKTQKAANIERSLPCV